MFVMYTTLPFHLSNFVLNVKLIVKNSAKKT